MNLLQRRKAEIFNRLGYEPTQTQAVVHLDEHRLRLVAGGERGGKSLLAAMELAGRFYEDNLYWLVGADYERTKPEFDYLADAFEKLGLLVSATKQVNPGLIILVGGIEIETKSAQDPRKLGMRAPRGILACEAAQLDVDTYQRLVARLAEKRGWMLMIGTFEGSLGWYPELYNRWRVENPEGGRSFSLPTWSNLKVFPGGRTDIAIAQAEAAMSKERFQERFAGVPCPPSGRVFTEFQVTLHVKPQTFDTSTDVILWVDPGYAGAYAVEAVQIRADTVHIIDEIYERGLVTEQIIQIAQMRPWWNRVTSGVVDIAGTQHQAMPAVSEIWLKQARLSLKVNKVGINEGIERLKTFLVPHPITGQPHIFIDPKAKGLISELGGGPNPFTGQTAVFSWKMDRSGVIVGTTPEDKNDHAIKAVIYGLVDRFGYATAKGKQVARVKVF